MSEISHLSEAFARLTSFTFQKHKNKETHTNQPTKKKSRIAAYKTAQRPHNPVASVLSLRTTLESKLREFQYKILNDIVFTNDKLFRFGLSQSPNCTFCNEEPESIEHLLSHCKVSFEFWKDVLSWLVAVMNTQ